MAWVTRWKIGPEWAAQHAKCVNAIAQNGPLRKMAPALNAPGAEGCPPWGESGGHFEAPADGDRGQVNDHNGLT